MPLVKPKQPARNLRAVLLPPPTHPFDNPPPAPLDLHSKRTGRNAIVADGLDDTVELTTRHVVAVHAAPSRAASYLDQLAIVSASVTANTAAVGRTRNARRRGADGDAVDRRRPSAPASAVVTASSSGSAPSTDAPAATVAPPVVEVEGRPTPPLHPPPPPPPPPLPPPPPPPPLRRGGAAATGGGGGGAAGSRGGPSGGTSAHPTSSPEASAMARVAVEAARRRGRWSTGGGGGGRTYPAHGARRTRDVVDGHPPARKSPGPTPPAARPRRLARGSAVARRGLDGHPSQGRRHPTRRRRLPRRRPTPCSQSLDRGGQLASIANRLHGAAGSIEPLPQEQ